MVYLSEVFALYYADAGGDETSSIALIEIDDSKLDSTLMYPDEDFIAQVFSEARNIGEAIPADLAGIDDVKELTKRIDPRIFQALTNTCRVNYGNVAYNGSVPVSAISRWVIVPFDGNSKLFSLARDPAVSPLSFRFVGEIYRALCETVINGGIHPVIKGSREEYLARPSIIVQTTPELHERIDGLMRLNRRQPTDTKEINKYVEVDRVAKYHDDVRKWNARAKAIYEAANQSSFAV